MALPVLLPLEVRSLTEPILCPVCRKPMQPTPDASGAFSCEEHGEWLPKDADDAGPPPTTRGQARPLPAGVYKSVVVQFPQAAEFNATVNHVTFAAQLRMVTLETLYRDPLPPVVQAPNKGGHGTSKKGGGSKSGRKRKKPPKKRRGPLEPYS